MNATDYYPFGMMMPGRGNTGSSGLGSTSYRFGFNGKENDNEVKGEGNQQDYGMRVYDSRLGRFLSVDPLTKGFPQLTPYQFSSNRPIDGIDLNGLEFETYKEHLIAKQGNSVLKKPTQKTPVVNNESQSNQSSGSMMGSLWHGASDGFFDMLHSGSKIFSRQTWSNVYGTAKDIVNMSTGNNKAAESFTQRATNFSYGLANSVSGPAVFLSTMHTRSLNENAYGIGYYGLQIGAIYLSDRLMQDIESEPSFEKNTPSNIPSRVARIIPEDYASGAVRLGAAEAPDVFVVDANDIKNITSSNALARKLTLLNEDGSFAKGPFRVIEFDTPKSGLASPFNRSNPGFINGGKTGGGANEYILPNLEIKALKNVTQTTIQ